MNVFSHPDIGPAIEEFSKVNCLRPLLVYGVPAVQEYPGTLLPDERLFLVYSKPACDCVHTYNRFAPAKIDDTCGFDRMFDIEEVVDSLVERTSLSYDVFRADQWATVYHYDPLLDKMVTKSRSKEGKYEMYNPKVLGESYLAAYKKWHDRLEHEFDPDLFFDTIRILLTSGKLVEEIQNSAKVPRLIPLSELMLEAGKEFSTTMKAFRDKWSRGEEIPSVWADLPDDIEDVIRNKRNEQTMILNAAKVRHNAEPYPRQLLMRLYADFVFALREKELEEGIETGSE